MLEKYLKNDGGLLNLLDRLKLHISSKRKQQLFLLFLLMVSLSFAEAISLASIIPFIGVFLNPDIFYSNQWLNLFVNFFEIKNSDELFLFVTLIFIFLILLSAFIKLMFVYLSNKITALTEADLKVKIFDYNIKQSFGYHLEQNSNIVMSNLVQKTQAIALFINGFIHILGSFMVILFVLSMLILIKPMVIISITLIIITFFIFIALINKKKNNKK